MLYIKEIFKSIQGEGFYTGKSSIFVRFTGCNLWNGKSIDREISQCSFCDTDFVGTNGKNGGIYNEKSLVEKINFVWNQKKSTEQKHVILTGGEPMLQVNSVLVNLLKENGYFVALETNGTLKISNISFDWICVSPKSMINWFLREGDEVKVIFPQYNLNLDLIKKMNFKYFFLQPMDGPKKQVNTWNTLNYCKSHKPWFPSFQIHKSLNIS
tara:strand:+ start:1205 stop:1840 length:636 start_codon:yes stop_codon:yes gene_type:complete